MPMGLYACIVKNKKSRSNNGTASKFMHPQFIVWAWVEQWLPRRPARVSYM
jgi:hypothetical protein